MYERLENRINGLIADQAKRSSWDREQQQLAAAVVRELQRRRKELRELVARGSRVRELAMAYAPGDPMRARILQGMVKSMEDGTKAVGLCNRGETNRTVTAKWSDLGIEGQQIVRDLWRQQDLGPFEDGFKASVPRHGVLLVRMRPLG